MNINSLKISHTTRFIYIQEFTLLIERAFASFSSTKAQQCLQCSI